MVIGLKRWLTERVQGSTSLAGPGSARFLDWHWHSKRLGEARDALRLGSPFGVPHFKGKRKAGTLLRLALSMRNRSSEWQSSTRDQEGFRGWTAGAVGKEETGPSLAFPKACADVVKQLRTHAFARLLQGSQGSLGLRDGKKSMLGGGQ